MVLPMLSASLSVGKGENLWKSLYVTTGSILVFVDADIKNIHPRYVYGLVGPLLGNPKLGYVKAFYRYYSGGSKKIRGWGRMTELLMRPLINMFFPRLSGIIQPSAGQFAGRRKVLERLIFYTGYGIEIAMLIDLQKKFGLKKIAQVDLGKCSHRIRGTGEKGVMAFGILQAFAKRANAHGKFILTDKVRKSYRIIECNEQGHLVNYKIKAKSVEDKIRPPMLTIKEYRKKYYPDKDILITES
jgi:glucosyl-3-phosphoglycerate synthase